MIVTSISIKEKKKDNIKKIERGFLKENHGLVGDVNAKGGYRQISIIGKKDREYLEKENIRGLCTKRFYENITIEDLNVEKLATGQKIIIGETVHKITSIGKRCFPECNLLNSNIPCPLSRGVVLTKVIKGGIIKIRDKVSVI